MSNQSVFTHITNKFILSKFCHILDISVRILTLRRFLAHYILGEDRKEIKVKEMLVLSIYFQW